MSVSGNFLSLMQKNKAPVNETMKMKYFMICTRGLVSGFAQGLYKNDSEVVSKNCMSETTYENVMALAKYSSSGNYVGIF